jgi:SAM-dependent methyltransferase
MNKSDRKISLIDRVKIKWEKKFGKAPYAKGFIDKDNEWFLKIYNSNPSLHKDFARYLREKHDAKSILEIGCGTGVYPIQNKELFTGKQYTGIDISESAIEYCKRNSHFEFLCGDFIKMNIPKKYDLVYSHAVIDHVYDIEAFLSKVVDVIAKYGYINSYRGYFPELREHRKLWDGHNGIYFNNLSVIQLKETLLRNGLSQDEFIIRPQQSGQEEKNVNIQTVIEIKMKS